MGHQIIEAFPFFVEFEKTFPDFKLRENARNNSLNIHAYPFLSFNEFAEIDFLKIMSQAPLLFFLIGGAKTI